MKLSRVKLVTLTLIAALSIPCSTYAGLSPQEVSEFKRTEELITQYREDTKDPVTDENFHKQKWARLGLGTFLLQLGNAYFLGHGVNKSDDDAFKAWREASELGNNNALFSLGYCYYAGIGVAKDEIEAYSYWVLCAYDLNKYEEIDVKRPSYELLEKRRKETQNVKNTELVKPCSHGVSFLFNSTDDAKNNAAVLEKAFTPDAQNKGLKRAREIEESLETISGKLRETKKAALLLQKNEFADLRKRAAAGDTEAQVEIAQYYNIGYYKDLKFLQDRNESDKWYKSAAEGGNIKAQMWLCWVYLADKKNEEALKWLKKASAQGSREAHELLAKCYLEGTGVPKSIIDAFAYLNISNFIGDDKSPGLAELELKMSPEERRLGLKRTKELHVEIDGRIKHSANKQIMIAMALMRGDEPDKYGLSSFFQVGPTDPIEGVRWFRKAAVQGDPDGQYRLGSAYAYGVGVREDKSEAAKWYLKAAEQGLAIAQYMLGHAYETGEGVPKDEIEAYAYFNLAGVTNEGARKRIASMEETMQPNFRLLAQQRTKELRKEMEQRLENLEDMRKAVEKEKQLKGI
jgi:TPR repeat protein